MTHHIRHARFRIRGLQSIRIQVFLCALGMALQTPLSAENWPQWRGPTQDGRAAPGKYPVDWSTTKNIVWSLELPGTGSSTPVVWNDQIFVTCGMGRKNVVLSLDRTGKEKWRSEVGSERVGKHRKATGSNPSCVTDGEMLFAYFKSGDLAGLTLDGTLVWTRNLQQEFGEDTLWWDLGTSPVLTSNSVVVACMHSGPSYLAAFTKKKGELSWKTDRNLDAPLEAAQSYSTPLVVGPAGKETIYTLGADHVTAHSAVDGREIWRAGGFNPAGEKYYRSIASPAIVGDILVAPYGRGNTVAAIRLGGTGDVTTSHLAWKKDINDKIGSDVPTPAAVDGQVFILSDKGVLACLETKTGKELWRGQVPPNRNAFSASPIIAGEYVYLTREDGTTFVVQGNGEFKLIAENKLDGFVVATPVFVDGKILIRTDSRLYCIGSTGT